MNRLTRRDFCRTIGGAGALVGTAVSKAFSRQARKLNILFLMTDQHTASVLGCAGNAVAKTPNLDRLASEGARFTHATCVTPFCSPTRASLLTGLYPHSHGIVGNVKPRQKGLVDPVACTESILHERGWITEQLGKWHLGDKEDLACYRGSESSEETKGEYEREVLEPLGDRAYSEGPRKGEVASRDVFFNSSMAAFRGVGSLRTEAGRTVNLPAAMGRMRVKPEYSYEWWLADRCIDFLETNQRRPFMLTFSVSPPHAPWICPSPYYDMYDPATIPLPKSFSHRPEYRQDETSARWGEAMGEANMREYLRCYYGQVSMMDAVVGRILAALARLGLEENTLVVYTSDHGDMQCAHNMPGKSLYGFYEEILRVPLILRLPNVIRSGSLLGCSAGSVDMMPTLLEYAGLPVPKGAAGRSLKPLLEGRSKKGFGAAFCERGSGATGKYGRMIRTATAKYCYYSDGRNELFDLENDPDEINNLIDSPGHQSLRRELHAQLLEQAERTRDPVRGGLSKA